MPRSPRSPGGSGPRSWTGSSPRPSSATTSPTSTRPRIRRTATCYVDPRHATIHDDDVHFAGTMRLEAELDIADALDLDRALAHGAESLKALGSEASLDARRSAALGDLARTQTALDLHARGATGARDVDDLPAAARSSCTPTSTPSLDELATVFGPTGRMEEGQRLVLLDQVKDWCGDSRTKVTIKPVIDLNAQLSTPAYEVPDRIREQVILRDRTCVFPWCTRPARGCDIDHVDPARPRRRGRGATTTRSDAERQPRRAVPVPPPPQDPHRLALPDGRARSLRVDQPARPPLPTRPHRHHRDRPSRATRPARHPPAPSTMTPPHTPPSMRKRGHRQVLGAHCRSSVRQVRRGLRRTAVTIARAMPSHTRSRPRSGTPYCIAS